MLNLCNCQIIIEYQNVSHALEKKWYKFGYLKPQQEFCVQNQNGNKQLSSFPQFPTQQTNYSFFFFLHENLSKQPDVTL